jgi:uroporphyrinogen decarboxylase
MPSNLQNDRFLRALNFQPTDYTPIWIMRQAGRYLPEYRSIRSKAGDFMTLCKTPELACEVTLQPLARFNLDAAILFSDILTIPDAMGLGLYFTEGEGPHFTNPIRTASDITKLGVPDPEKDLNYVTSAIKMIQHELSGKVPLIGFSGSPWTLATYMVEGRSSKSFDIIKAMLYQNPAQLQQLLSVLTRAVIEYLNAQIAAGVNAVMLFDTWGGLLTTSAYQTFSLLPMTEIIAKLKPNKEGNKVPVILFTKNSSQWLESIAQSGCNAIGIDWTIELDHARARVGNKVALQGNMDPAVLYAAPEKIRDEVQKILASYGTGNGHIFNLGHGIFKNVPPENVAVLVDAVHEFSRKYHQ